MIRKFNILFLLLHLSIHTIYAQESKLTFAKKITISNGLAHNGVSSVFEDSNGFLWIGTYEGLNKYDGIKLTTYKNAIDLDILTSNRVRSISEDKNKNLLIGTDEGLTIYNTERETFFKAYTNKDSNDEENGPIIRKILISKKNSLIYCLTEGNGVLVFDATYKLVKKIFTSTKYSSNLMFYKALELENGNIIFSSSEGLFLYKVSSDNKIEKILSSEITASNFIVKIDATNFLSTLNNGLAVFSLNKNNEFILKKKIFINDNFNSIKLDSKGNLWLGTLNDGILQIENFTSALKNDFKEPFKEKRFTDNLNRLRISRIISSSNNNIWVGTFDEGLYQFNIKENPFKTYKNNEKNINKVLTTGVNFMSKYDKNRVFIVTISGNLNLFNTKTNTFDTLPFKLPKNFKIGGVFVDSKKNIWLKVNEIDGLYIVRNKNNTLEKITHKSLENSDGFLFRSFSEDKEGNIWIGTSNNVYKITVDKNTIIKNIESLNSNPFFKKNKLKTIRYIYADHLKEYIWIGSGHGFFRLENKKNVALKNQIAEKYTTNKEKKNSISSNFVTSIIRLPNEELWISTENGGICRVLENGTSLEFIPYTEKEGLSNNAAKNILYDNEHGLWIPTNIGLNKFDLKSKQFRKFNLADGLPFEDFWFTSEKLENGVLLFSGLNTFSYFNPQEISKSEELPNTYLSNFKVFNKLIKSGDTLNNRVLLNENISKQERIVLNYDENVFSFELISLHFSNPKNHTIKYKLSKVNKDWIILPSNENIIRYSGLQPDKYEFTYMASNSLNEWSAPKKLFITITPPFWKTYWAYFGYFVLLVLFIYAIVFSITKIQSLHHKVTIEKLELDSIKELNESKLRYFSNISHEIKTPITLITNPIETLTERYKNNLDVSEKLGLVKRQLKKIKQLVDQVQDFRRADANMLKMHYSRFNFNKFIDQLVKDFDFLAKKDQKTFSYSSKEKNIIVSADKDKIEKIINNLISNAFKYTRANDTINIDFRSNEKDLTITVSDSGMGIDEEDLEHVFERFYQSQSIQKEHISGSGIGLAFTKKLVEMHYGYIKAESKINKGTTITIQLPIVKIQIEEDEIIDEVIELPEEKEIKIDKQFIKQEILSDIKVSGDFSDTLIFYAEDNLEMRNYVSDILSKYFKIKVFRNGQECLDALEDEWPDIVISDVQMPVLNGLDLCISIKSNLKTSHIPVILLTALSNIEDHVRGIRDGADAYIKKPFNVQRLVTNVEALLINRKQLRERFQVGIPLTKENNKNNRNDNAFLEKLYSIIEENLDNQDFDINSLSRELYLNRTHFYQKVKELTNQTPFEILKTYRLKKAAQLLAQEKLPVNEVFLMTGFKNRHHFSKTFKKMYNVSPSKFAEEKSEEHTS
ncbi:Two component regulator propeller [Polaribacter sp. KT25b]|uniref:hybrid sensor histidine kinase/response regulator transcription factor n=1 Tax=Polaribacter sp. KT25b TaxID=1855336 RepID=UPI00087CBF74|nr:hybrid sensor histidine kinase/response regulator transcription factor [Polaribacter sp. KT25b]SDR70664.1 Two component regulator propeller [Polaribacter sp. KT25b]